MPREKTSEKTSEKTTKVILKDEYATDATWFLELTESQVRLLKWLDSNEMLHDEISFEILCEQNNFKRI